MTDTKTRTLQQRLAEAESQAEAIRQEQKTNRVAKKRAEDAAAAEALQTGKVHDDTAELAKRMSETVQRLAELEDADELDFDALFRAFDAARCLEQEYSGHADSAAAWMDTYAPTGTRENVGGYTSAGFDPHPRPGKPALATWSQYVDRLVMRRQQNAWYEGSQRASATVAEVITEAGRPFEGRV